MNHQSLCKDPLPHAHTHIHRFLELEYHTVTSTIYVSISYLSQHKQIVKQPSNNITPLMFNGYTCIECYQNRRLTYIFRQSKLTHPSNSPCYVNPFQEFLLYSFGKLNTYYRFFIKIVTKTHLPLIFVRAFAKYSQFPLGILPESFFAQCFKTDVGPTHLRLT